MVTNMTEARRARERAQRARDYRETLAIVSAAVAPSPELLVRVTMLEQRLADQARMIEHLQAKVAELEARPVEDEDGQPPRERGKWLRLKAAARSTGYSVSGLKKMCQSGRCVFDYEGPHRLINIDTVSRKVPKVPKVSP
jgi:hypothetical protein